MGALEGIICDGAIRSGKTVSMTVGFFLWSMCCFDGGVFALCGKTVGSLRRNMVIHLDKWLGGIFTVTECRSENKLVLTDRSGHSNTYYLFGGEDESSAKLIQGITLCGVLLDEVALMPRSFVEQACARCSEPGSKLWFNCNPEGPEHWFYKDWICNAAQKKLLRLHFTMEDNPGLGPQIRQRYERLYSGVFYRRFILGQWCVAEGLVYDFDAKRHVSGPPEKGRWFISVDYGTRNPFSAGLWCVNAGIAYRVREYYHDGRQAGMRTDAQYHDALVALAGDAPVELVVIDPSASSLIATIREKGRFRVRRAKNQVLPGIRLVQQYLLEGRLQFDPGCKDTIREFSLYRWGEGDQPRKEHDHAMDEVRYFAATVLQRL